MMDKCKFNMMNLKNKFQRIKADKIHRPVKRKIELLRKRRLLKIDRKGIRLK
jgi:hypothetical protein